jgi:hypothetical protein
MKFNDNSVTERAHNKGQCHLLEQTAVWHSFSLKEVCLKKLRLFAKSFFKKYIHRKKSANPWILIPYVKVKT